MLNEKEVWQLATDNTIGGDLHADRFARAIEQAVIAKLAGVSVEPLFWVYEAGTPGGYFYFIEVDRTRKDGNYRDKKCWEESPVFTELQLAAARVQALEEAAKVCDRQAIPNAGFLAEKVRALINARANVRP